MATGGPTPTVAGAASLPSSYVSGAPQTAEQFKADEVKWMVVDVDPPRAFIHAVERAYMRHIRGQLEELGRVQQAFARGSVERFSESWASLLNDVHQRSHVNNACGLWNPAQGCVEHYKAVIGRVPRM